MFKRIIGAIIALTMVASMCSCSEQESSSQPTQPTPSSPSVVEPASKAASPTANYTFVGASDGQKHDDSFITGLNSFSVEMFKGSVKDDLSRGKNTLVSPESVAFALGMTANGANGETLEQMRNTLCSDVDMDTFNKNMNLLMTNAEKSTEKEKLAIANSVWVKDIESMTLKDQFAKICKEKYDAEMYRAAFDQATVAQMNSWVNEKTDKMIPSIIDNLDEQARVVLINCIAFDAKWANPYESDQVNEGEDFTNAKGEKVKCDMLYGSERQYVSDGKAQGFVKNYAGRYAFMALLPNEGVSLSEYVDSMTADSFAKLYSDRTNQYKVYTRLPKFKYDYDITLNETLQAMGITTAFTDASDFSNMSDTELKISSVLHKTHIELDADGTKAAAATAVTMDAKAALEQEEVKNVYLDRPFAYAIMDTETGLPVFMGTVCDPSVQ